MSPRLNLEPGPAAVRVLASARDLDWQERAACQYVDAELFFPPKGGSALPAKRVCAACPVKVPCLEYALGCEEEFGVFGGLSAWERYRLLAPRRAQREAALAVLKAELGARARRCHPDGRKRCAACLEVRDLREFSYSSYYRDGLSYRCGPCRASLEKASPAQAA